MTDRTPPPLRRLIAVDVRDGDGALLPGFRLDWRENGQFRGTLTSSTGLARLEPVRDDSTIEIDIDYPGQPLQRQKLAVGQTAWTFHYPGIHHQPSTTAGSAAPPEPQKSGSNLTQIIVALIGLVGVIVVGYWQFGPKSGTTTREEVTLTVYIKSRDGGAIHDAQVRLERSAGIDSRGADDNGVARFTLATGAGDAPRVVVSAPGFQEKTQSVPAIDRDASMDVFLDPLPAPPAARQPPQPGSTSRAPNGT